MVYDLPKMKLLARGGQADIYEIDSLRILRVLREPDEHGVQALHAERSIMALLRTQGVNVPEVYEAGDAGGLPAYAMQRISGPSMLEKMMRNPLNICGYAKALADLHAEFLSTVAPGELRDINERAKYLINRAALLDGDDKTFALTLLGSLPGGGVLMHGDFHPGNILTDGGRYYIIDWFGATKGDPVSDVAHTYLLCANKPRIPGESAAKHYFQKAFARSFGRAYLKRIRLKLGFGMDEFGKWLAVRAAERSVYGQPSERAGRASFVRACRKAQLKGTGSAGWHKLL